MIVVSDMHIGRDCKEITGFAGTQRPNPEFDRHFIDMLDFYTLGKESEWKLVIAGDFIDFMEVVVTPKGEGPLDLKLSFEVTDEEKEFGLGSEAERCIVKLQRTFEYHQDFFKRLAQYVKGGGELVVMRGNHDVEFYWGKVQRYFRKHLADIAFRGQHLDVDEAIDQRNVFQERLIFAPWLYFEPGRVYIEHGHQYDVYCSFDHWLHPVSPTNPRRIDTPLSAFAMRYFVNLLTDFAAHDVDLWGVKDYINWLKEKGVAGSLYIGRMGLYAGYRIVEYAARFSVGRVGRYAQEHGKKLTQEAERFGLPLEKAIAVDNLHHTPVSRNLSEVMRLLFLDRLLLVVGTAWLMFMSLLIFDDVWFQFFGVVFAGVLGYLINRRLAPRRYLQPGPKQIAAAKRIAEILEVPVVVMGHSHVRRDKRIGRNSRFINTGCWLPPLPGRAVAPSGEGEELAGPGVEPAPRLSHLVLEPDGLAELRLFVPGTKSPMLAPRTASSIVALETDPEIPASGTLDLITPKGS